MIDQFKNICNPNINGLHYGEMYFDWIWKEFGFGDLSFSFNPETSKLECMNAQMSRENVRKILHSMADFIADRAILTDTPGDVPPVDIAAEIKKQTDAYYEDPNPIF